MPECAERQSAGNNAGVRRKGRVQGILPECAEGQSAGDNAGACRKAGAMEDAGIVETARVAGIVGIQEREGTD